MTDRTDPALLRRTYRLPEKDRALLAECDVTFFRASGPGGQHRNTTLSAVRLHHRASGLVVIGKRERSQPRNLDDALTRLRERLRRILIPPKPRRPTRPTKASKEKRLGTKRRRSRVKEERGPGDWD